MLTNASDATNGTKQKYHQERRRLLEPWPGPWKMWAEKFCRANHWRVAWYLGDYEDCVQECAYIFVECQRKYGAVVQSPAHFMSLYKTMVQTWFHDYSNYDTKIRDVAEKEAVMPSLVPSVELDELLVYRTRKSSNEVKEVVKLLLGSPGEVLDELCREVISAKKYLEAVIRKTGIVQQEGVEKVKRELREALVGTSKRAVL